MRSPQSDTSTGAIEFSIGGIVQPSEVLSNRRESRLFVSARGEGTIKVIDLASLDIVADIAVGAQPESMLLSRDERTLVVTMRGTPAQLAFVDTRSLTLIETIAIGGSDTFGDLAAMSDNRRFVYATFDRGTTGTGGVVVVDMRTRSVVDTWDYPGLGRPHGIAFTSRVPR